MSESVLGKDIEINFKEGDLKLSDNSDFSLVSGYDNLSQAINLRLTTDLGAMETQSTYGSELRKVYGLNTETGEDQAVLYTQESLEQEPRISSISDIEPTITGNSLQLELTVTPIEEDNQLNILVNFT